MHNYFMAEAMTGLCLLAPVLLAPTLLYGRMSSVVTSSGPTSVGVLRPIHPACRTDLTTKKVLSLQGRVLLTLLSMLSL